MKDVLNDYSIGQYDDILISYKFVFELISDLAPYKVDDEIKDISIGNEICAIRCLLNEIEKLEKKEISANQKETKDRYFISYEKLKKLISTVTDLYHCRNLNDYLFPLIDLDV